MVFKIKSLTAELLKDYLINLSNETSNDSIFCLMMENMAEEK